MRPANRNRWNVTAVMTLSAIAVWASADVRGATIVPMTQQRSVHAMVMVPPCAPPSVVSDNDSAIGFGPFTGDVEAPHICDLAQGIATAAQRSHINAASLIATGDTSCQVFSVNQTVIHAIPSSVFIVTFQTTSPVRYFIDGELSASGGLPVVISYARVRLTNAANQVLVERQVNPHPGGAMNTLAVHEIGALQPGQYTLNIQTTAAVDAMVPPNGSGASSFNITAQFQRPGDANIDGTVDIYDLLAVIAGWGPCPAPPATCAADVTLDGVVDIDDLLLVIGNWG